VDGKYTRGYGNLSLDQVRDFVEEFKEIINTKKLHVQVTGGEPTVRKDIVEIISVLGREINDLGMTTNGSMLNRDFTSQLVENGLSDLHVHLASLDKDVIEKTTRVTCHKDSINNILESVKLMQELGKRVEFNTPVTPINKASLAKLMDFCYENRINLKLIEELRLNDTDGIEYSEIKEILDNWLNSRQISFNETKIINRFGNIYAFDEDFSFRIAPVDEDFKDSLVENSNKTLLDGRYWVGGSNGKFLFTPSYSILPETGTIEDLKLQFGRTLESYEKQSSENVKTK
jgi:molybdenum cofactor biosynthesis enzyme MoaA